MRAFSGCGLLAAAIVPSLVLAESLNHQRLPQRLEHRQDTATTTASAPAGVTSTAFDALATNNVGVYFGHAEDESDPSMYPLCTNPDVDIVIVSFVRQFNGLDNLPTFDFGATCESDGSSSTLECPELTENITLCQSLGKKVFLSMGGSSSNLTFDEADQAVEAAQILWNVFGAGTNTTSRPFGDVVLDGFDFDIESGASTEHFDVFAESLQGLFRNSSIERYITAAPLCANNTALPSGFYENTNFVWPRFYNAQACGLGSDGFNASIAHWFDYVDGINSNISSDYPRLYISALAFDNNNTGGGYVDADEFAKEVVGIHPNITNLFGGVALWEGTDAMLNTNSKGKDYIEVVKTALNTVSSSTSAGTRSSGFGWSVWLISVLALLVIL